MTATLIPTGPLAVYLRRWLAGIPEHVERDDDEDAVYDAAVTLRKIDAGDAECVVCAEAPADPGWALYHPDDDAHVAFPDAPVVVDLPATFDGICLACRAEKIGDAR